MSMQAPRRDLTPQVAAIEQQLEAMDAALVAQDSALIESCSHALHRALSDISVAFRSAGPDALTPALRQKLLLAQERVTGLQNSVLRASGAVERTLGVLLPQEATPTYSALASRSAQSALSAYRT